MLFWTLTLKRDGQSRTFSLKMSWEISLAMWIDQIQMFTALLPARKHTLALHTSVYRARRRILPSQTPWCTCMLPWKAFPVWLTAVMEVKISLINWEDGWEWEAAQRLRCTASTVPLWHRVPLLKQFVNIAERHLFDCDHGLYFAKWYFVIVEKLPF